MIPGEICTAAGEIELNQGRETVNRHSGKQRRSAHPGRIPLSFLRNQSALQFDRETTKGFRLNIAAGTAVRFEPGQQRQVELVALCRCKKYIRFQCPGHGRTGGLIMARITRKAYAEMFGPTTGDRVRWQIRNCGWRLKKTAPHTEMR